MSNKIICSNTTLKALKAHKKYKLIKGRSTMNKAELCKAINKLLKNSPKKASPKKPSPKKTSPKKVSSKKANPKKPSPKKDDESIENKCLKLGYIKKPVETKKNSTPKNRESPINEGILKIMEEIKSPRFNYLTATGSNNASITIFYRLSTAFKGHEEYIISTEIDGNKMTQSIITNDANDKRIYSLLKNLNDIHIYYHPLSSPAKYKKSPIKPESTKLLKDLNIISNADLKKWLLKNHPDKGGCPTLAQKVLAAAKNVGIR